MQGVMLIFKPGADEPEIRTFSRAADLGDLKDAIAGGWLEKVPGFGSIEHKGELHPCVALVDEEGKLPYRTSGKPSPCAPDLPNPIATKLWEQALLRAGHPGLLLPKAQGGGLADYLVGRVAVVYGDDEFMEAL